MSGHTHTYTHTYTHDNYYNPRCAHAHRGLIILIIITFIYFFIVLYFIAL